jgi:uncharacterized protein (TIGR02453 family)
MPSPPHFTKATIPLLTAAGRQTDPGWLDRRRDEYDEVVRLPFVALAKTIAREIKPLAPRYHVPTKGIGRIKIPSYKVGRGDPAFKDWLSLRAAIPTGDRFVYNPHLFFGILPNEPGWEGVFVAGGMYKPKSDQIRRVREAIADDPAPFHALFRDPTFTARFTGDFDRGSTNVRVPRGFDEDHPDITWIKLRNFTVIKKLSMKEFTSSNLASNVVADFRPLLRLNAVLLAALA